MGWLDGFMRMGAISGMALYIWWIYGIYGIPDYYLVLPSFHAFMHTYLLYGMALWLYAYGGHMGYMGWWTYSIWDSCLPGAPKLPCFHAYLLYGMALWLDAYGGHMGHMGWLYMYGGHIVYMGFLTTWCSLDLMFLCILTYYMGWVYGLMHMVDI